MKPFAKHTGLVTPMDWASVDMDQIIPREFLKRIERTGYGRHPGKSEADGGSS